MVFFFFLSVSTAFAILSVDMRQIDPYVLDTTPAHLGLIDGDILDVEFLDEEIEEVRKGKKIYIQKDK